MNILVVNGHPDLHSFSSVMLEEVLKNLDREKHNIKALELGKMDFDPVLRFGYRERMTEDKVIVESQSLIQWADHFIFIYPIWWSGMPSLMKGWVERVFTPGIAYSSNRNGNFIVNYLLGRQFKKLLKGKTATIYTTSMAPSWWYTIFSGWISVPDSYGVAALKGAVLNHCGIKTKRIRVLGNMGREGSTLEKRKKFLEQIARDIKKL